MNKLFSFLILGFTTFTLSAQYQIGLIPRTSPDKGIYQKIGFTEIDINYGSPKVNDRSIWNELVPFDEVWRAGANEATTIEFSNDVVIEGQYLEQGKYAFFIIPRAIGSWTAIFNKKFKQWGAYNYDETQDALRVSIEPNEIKHSEELNYFIEDYGYNFGKIGLVWEKVRLELNIETNYLKILEEKLYDKLDKAPEETHFVIYLQAAEFLLVENENLQLANNWINQAEALYSSQGEWNKQYYPKKYVLGHLYWTKASILAKRSYYNEALVFVDKMKAIKGKYSFYKQENRYGELDNLIAEWQNKL